MTNEALKIPPRVGRAIAERRPLVALESTVIAHGLPSPLNLQTAQACEQAVANADALAATIGIVAGVPTIGLSEEEIETFAAGRAPDGHVIEKVGLNNLAGVMAKRRWGATTVAGTMRIARMAGLQVFATGGIGGVHRGAASSFDISADLTALAQVPLVCVCAGAKAILDLPATREVLETLGVPVVGLQTDEFPAFYSRASGLAVDAVAESAAEAAEMAIRHWRSGSTSAVLVGVPVPAEFEIPAGDIEAAVVQAVGMAEAAGVRGKGVTPFLLEKMKEITGGRTLAANRALLVNNAAAAAQIAVKIVELNRSAR